MPLAPYLITPGVSITNSTELQSIFFQPPEPIKISGILGGAALDHVNLYISSLPDVPAPIIVDDGIFVNGHLYSGFAGTLGNPKDHIGSAAETSYKAVEAIPINGDLRSDGLLYIQLMDLGGYTYTASRLYVMATSK
jgi:hypothetical protein